MVVLYKDPEGTTVFKTTNTRIRSQPNDVDDNNISTLRQTVTELESKEPEGTQVNIVIFCCLNVFPAHIDSES